MKNDIEVANNPRILHIFAHMKSDNNQYEVGMTLFNQYMRQLATDLISTMNYPVFNRSLKDCLIWLEYARHGTPLNSGEKSTYMGSYLHEEHLTTCIEESEDEGESERKIHTIKLLIPSMYSILLEQLKAKFHLRDDHHVLEHPVVRGYVFEERFLQCESLHFLSVWAVNAENASAQAYTFSSLLPALFQQKKAITAMTENQIYHLRPKHPAIDGVCVAEEANREKYLLLLQVPLSTYKMHESKGNDIRKHVELQYEGKYKAGQSIAQYYKELAGVREDKNVIYVYISPKQLESPSKTTFSLELQRCSTGTGTHPPNYWYGFCSENMKEMIQQNSEL